MVVSFHLFSGVQEPPDAAHAVNPMFCFQDNPPVAVDGGGEFSAQVFVLPNHRPAGPPSRCGTLAPGTAAAAPEAVPPESLAWQGRTAEPCPGSGAGPAGRGGRSGAPVACRWRPGPSAGGAGARARRSRRASPRGGGQPSTRGYQLSIVSNKCER